MDEEEKSEEAGAFQAAFQAADTTRRRLTEDCPRFDEARAFSPQAYNAISSAVLRSLYRCIEKSAKELPAVPFYSNLALIYACELQSSVSQHYFNEYERVHRFVDRGTVGGRRIHRRTFTGRVLWRAGKVASRARSQIGRDEEHARFRAACFGNTTFPWHHLRPSLRPRGISISTVREVPDSKVPAYTEQMRLLRAWLEALQSELLPSLSAGRDRCRPFDITGVGIKPELVSPQLSPTIAECDLLLTGAMPAAGRALALAAQAEGIHVASLHHGSHYLVFDEPFYDLYEGALPDTRIAYGAVEKTRQIGCAGPAKNLFNKPIRLYSRPDPLISATYQGGPIEDLGSLRGKKVLYLAVEFDTARYGPFRDVHPQTYMDWQASLLAWLEHESGRAPFVRFHPKRPSTRYDLARYQQLAGNMRSVLDIADVFVIDYPTTSLAYVAATRKPVLFFDLGLRRLHPAALEATRARCHCAPTDVLDPIDGFAAMKRDLSRPCRDDFTPLFSLPSTPGNELESVCEALTDVLERETPA